MIGTVYRIIHLHSNLQYVGSTMNELRYRWKSHKESYRKWINEKTRNHCTMYPHFKEHGIENFKIVLIKQYEVVDQKHLLAYECLWVNKLKCVNRQNPFRIKRLSDKDKAIRNKESITEYKNDWYQKNKARILERSKEKYNCECGANVGTNYKSKHERTKKHQMFLSS